MQASGIYTLLALLGTMPFLASAFALILGYSSFFDIHIVTIVTSYALAIISFLCGTHWGMTTQSRAPCYRMIIQSNIITLVAWFSFLLLNTNFQLVIFIFLFIWLLMMDRKMHKDKQLSTTYFALRKHATLIVTVSLCVISIVSF